MGMLERLKDTQNVVNREVNSDFPGLVQIAQGAPADVLHHDVRQRNRGTIDIPLFFAGIKDGDDVRVVQAGNCLGLAPEASLNHGFTDHFRAQQFNGNLTAEDLVDAQMDIGHASPANELANGVATLENTFAGHRLFPIVI